MTYQQLHGNLEVPASFVVPESEEWREERWGRKLGVTVKMIRTADDFVRDNQERRQSVAKGRRLSLQDCWH
jgi:hypothetical protein